MDRKREEVIERRSHGALYLVEDMDYGHREHQPPQPSPWQNRQKHRHAPARRRACRMSIMGMEVRSLMSQPLGGRCWIVMDAAAMPGNAKSAVRVE